MVVAGEQGHCQRNCLQFCIIASAKLQEWTTREQRGILVNKHINISHKIGNRFELRRNPATKIVICNIPA